MNFSNLKVLVIGDCCLDIITDGECTRISPEAPVPVIKNPIKNYSLGMAANVALNLKNLGADVDLFSFTGEDGPGEIVRDLMVRYDLCDKHGSYESCEKNPTIVKERIMANGHQIARIDIESANISPENVATALYSGFGHNLYDLIIISDYDKGLLNQRSWNLVKPILDDINKNNLYFVDTKKINVLDFYKGMVLFPNSSELRKIKNAIETECFDAEDFRQMLDSSLLIETAAEMGAYAYTVNNMHYSPAIISEVFDVTGAGDTFISAFSLYFTKHNNIQKSLDFANYCCSKVVMKKGTVPIEFSEVMDFDTKAELR